MESKEIRNRLKQIMSGVDFRVRNEEDSSYVLGIVIGNLQSIVQMLTEEEDRETDK